MYSLSLCARRLLPSHSTLNCIRRKMSETRIEVPWGCDLHVHLRQGPMMKMVVPLIRQGGCRTVVVMPNLIPPISNVDMALNYWNELKSLDNGIEYLMTLYLNQDLTPQEIEKAAKCGIKGVKSYPRGVTTNSENGIEDYEIYYPIFEAMQQHDLVLNLHGEIPSDNNKNICVLNAEERFLPELEKIHKKFPKLRIVLEHVTSKAAVELVKSLGDTVAATITLHHLELTIDDVGGKNHHFCKPIAKFPEDREALIQIIREGHPRFFLGSDSAPHVKSKKESDSAPAGIFTTPYLFPYLATILEKVGCLDKLKAFSSTNGQRFYKLEQHNETIVLEKSPLEVVNEFSFECENQKECVVPFWGGKTLPWKITSSLNLENVQ